MMKEEIKRIMNLVKEGKLSPEDGAELIEAFQSAPDEYSETARDGSGDESKQSDEAKKTDGFSGFIDAIEKLGKDVATSVNWNDVAEQVKSGAKKGLDHLKTAVDNARQGKNPFMMWGAAVTRELTLPLFVPAGKSLRIDNPNGDIRVRGGESDYNVTAFASFRAFDSEDARLKAEGYTLVIEESDQYVTLRQPDISGLCVDLEIRIGAGCPVEIRTESGDVEVLNTKAACKLNAKSGNVRVVGFAGATDISTVSGDVSMSDGKDVSLTIENKSGEISVYETNGSMSVRTTAGNVRIEGCSGSPLTVEAISGDVAVDLDRPVRGTLSVRTVSGDANINVPDGSDARVAISTLKGIAKCELELEDRAEDHQRITGRLGDGSGTIDVSAINGNIRLALHAEQVL